MHTIETHVSEGYGVVAVLVGFLIIK